MVKRKRRIKRVTKAARMLGRGDYVCRQCWPYDELHKDSHGEPVVATIYVGRKVIEIGKSKHTLLIAWCASCKRWLAKEKKWRVTLENVDVGTMLSDGECGKGLIGWEKFVELVKWKKRGK